MGNDLTLESLYEEAKKRGLLAPGWQSDGKTIWNALHVVIVQAASAEQEIKILEKLISVAQHPFCPCTKESVCKPACCHYSSILSYSCKWCSKKWKQAKRRLELNQAC